MRTSSHYQPEAQHPNSSAIHKLPADYPIFRHKADMSRQPRACPLCGPNRTTRSVTLRQRSARREPSSVERRRRGEFGSPIDRLSRVTVSDPRARARRSLRSRAILHETVTATGVDVDDALTAAAHRTRTRIPLPRLLRSGRAAVRWVKVWVDIGLCIRRLRADDHCQKAQATDQSALHDFSPIGQRG